MKKKSVFTKMKKYRFFYVMLLPIAVYFILFNYYPLALGIVKSFQEVKILGDSEFVGLANYSHVVGSMFYRQAFVNTLIVNLGGFVLQFFWGLLIALLVNEVRLKLAKSVFQSVTYLPYLLSWSVVGGIWIASLAPSGMINGFLQLFMGDSFKPIVFMAEPAWARTIFVFTNAWKGAGYTAVLFLAAIVSIDTSIYEAASIDGASRMQQILRITLPNLIPTAKVVIVLGTMGILRNFDQIYAMANSSIYDKVRNLLFLIYQDGIVKSKTGQALAAATIVLLGTLIISTIVRKLTKYDESYE